ncbi:hypothetical protein MNBD_GAMMA06-1492 [hydrothermal vent metagenome]|uniref:Uncharacterized protein n=1 Tax=hydrothermal vent metagenome TaxID=652676 RepID=A0A3B0WJ45_9ZZZZ
MSETLFDIVFFGILQPGKDKETVMQNMAALFKTDANKLTPYFSGERKVIKGKINAAAAEKYKVALENVGLSIKIEPCEVAGTNETAAKPEQNKETNIDTSGLTLAAAGSDVVENPVATPAQKINDISDISMSEIGANVIENPIITPAQKIDDISDISMADAGSDVFEKPPEKIAPQQIDSIDGVNLAEAGADLIENPKPVAAAKIPDTGELSLSDEKT